MEMHQLQAVTQVLRFENLRGSQKLDGAQSELCVFAPAFGPLAGALAREPRANSNNRLDPHVPRDLDDVPQLLQLFHHQNDFLSQLDSNQSHLDEARILVSVANDHATG